MPRTAVQPDAATTDEAPARSRPFGFAHFTIFGRLAADAELRFAGTGNPVSRTVLAVNDRGGQAHYLDVVVFGESAKTLAQYGTKGRRLVVYGRVSTRSWEAEDGGRRKTVDLIAEEFHFADRAHAAATE